MKKSFVNIASSHLDCLSVKMKDRFGIDMGSSYNGEKEFMGASVSYKYDKEAEVFHVDLSIGFPANMSYSEKNVLDQFEQELIKCGWVK